MARKSRKRSLRRNPMPSAWGEEEYVPLDLEPDDIYGPFLPKEYDELAEERGRLLAEDLALEPVDEQQYGPFLHEWEGRPYGPYINEWEAPPKTLTGVWRENAQEILDFARLVDGVAFVGGPIEARSGNELHVVYERQIKVSRKETRILHSLLTCHQKEINRDIYNFSDLAMLVYNTTTEQPYVFIFKAFTTRAADAFRKALDEHSPTILNGPGIWLYAGDKAIREIPVASEDDIADDVGWMLGLVQEYPDEAVVGYGGNVFAAAAMFMAGVKTMLRAMVLEEYKYLSERTTSIRANAEADLAWHDVVRESAVFTLTAMPGHRKTPCPCLYRLFSSMVKDVADGRILVREDASYTKSWKWGNIPFSTKPIPFALTIESMGPEGSVMQSVRASAVEDFVAAMTMFGYKQRELSEILAMKKSGMYQYIEDQNILGKEKEIEFLASIELDHSISMEDARRFRKEYEEELGEAVAQRALAIDIVQSSGLPELPDDWSDLKKNVLDTLLRNGAPWWVAEAISDANVAAFYGRDFKRDALQEFESPDYAPKPYTEHPDVGSALWDMDERTEQSFPNAILRVAVEHIANPPSSYRREYEVLRYPARSLPLEHGGMVYADRIYEEDKPSNFVVQIQTPLARRLLFRSLNTVHGLTRNKNWYDRNRETLYRSLREGGRFSFFDALDQIIPPLAFSYPTFRLRQRVIKLCFGENPQALIRAMNIRKLEVSFHESNRMDPASWDLYWTERINEIGPLSTMAASYTELGFHAHEQISAKSRGDNVKYDKAIMNPLSIAYGYVADVAASDMLDQGRTPMASPSAYFPNIWKIKTEQGGYQYGLYITLDLFNSKMGVYDDPDMFIANGLGYGEPEPSLAIALAFFGEDLSVAQYERRPVGNAVQLIRLPKTPCRLAEAIIQRLPRLWIIGNRVSDPSDPQVGKSIMELILKLGLNDGELMAYRYYEGVDYLHALEKARQGVAPIFGAVLYYYHNTNTVAEINPEEESINEAFDNRIAILHDYLGMVEGVLEQKRDEAWQELEAYKHSIQG